MPHVRALTHRALPCISCTSAARVRDASSCVRWLHTTEALRQVDPNASPRSKSVADVDKFDLTARLPDDGSARAASEDASDARRARILDAALTHVQREGCVP
jgi:hypothetical protein